MFPQQSSKPQRVCATCFRELSSSGASDSVMPTADPMDDSDSDDTDDEEQAPLSTTNEVCL